MNSASEDQSSLINPALCDELLHRWATEKPEQHEHEHQHSHVPDASWRLLVMVFLNFFVFIAELVTGYLTNSLALQSDAWHMLSDEAGLIIGYFANRLSKRLPTETMTFGWARTEVLGGLVNATFLLAVSLMIAFDAIERFFNPPEIEKPLLFIIVGTIGLITNIIGLFMFRDHSHSDNIKGVFLHVMGDFLGSIGVMITALVYYFTDWTFKRYIDPLFSLIIVGILVKGCVSLFKKTAMAAAERCPDSVSSNLIRDNLLAVPGVVALHELHVWELCRNSLLSTIHLVAESKDVYTSVLQQVHNLMIGFGVYSSTVQIEFAEDFPEGIDRLGHCAYASSLGKSNRAFLTPPAYRHIVGCPHVNLPGQDESDDSDHEHQRHDYQPVTTSDPSPPTEAFEA
jgi:cobalt-zinc-cadmium efflux system protein